MDKNPYQATYERFRPILCEADARTLADQEEKKWRKEAKRQERIRSIVRQELRDLKDASDALGS